MNCTLKMGLLLMLVCPMWVGCQGPGAGFQSISGSYVGTLITHSAGAFQQVVVHTEIRSDSEGVHSYVMKDPQGESVLTLSFRSQANGALSFRSSIILDAPMDLTLNLQSGCYLGQSVIRVSFCAAEPEIDFEIDDSSDSALLSLVLYPSGSGMAGQQGLDQPQAFTLTQAIERAKSMSFQSRIEFEHVMQAKMTATASYLRLLPQLTLGTVVNNLTPGFTSLLAAVGDLAPFLLPSRWIQAGIAHAQSNAEIDTNRLMRLNMAVDVEGLVYAYDHDGSASAIYRAFSERMEPILADVQKRESSGQLEPGSTDTVQAAINDMTHNVDVLTQVITEDLSSLSQSLGFFSPLVVKDATIDQEKIPIEAAPMITFASVNESAIARSFEVDQLRALIDAAKLAKEEEYFDWLDPVGNPSLGLGASLPSQVRVAQSQIDELRIVRDQMQSIVSQKVLNAVTDYGQALDDFSDAQSDLTLHEHRLVAMLQQMDAGVRIDAFDLCSIISDDIGAQLNVTQARADYRVARAEIDRLLLRGYYSAF